MTQEQFDHLPETFQEIIVLDRALTAPVVTLEQLRQRRRLRRMAQIIIHQPRSGGSNRSAA